MSAAASKISDNPLQRIALTCSGGGYRATSFHLGAMSYLNHLTFEGRPLLQKVKTISTVSGGTFTGVIYASRIIKGDDFKEVYRFIMGKLRTLDLVQLGLQKLGDDGEWKFSHKSKNLINAFAEIYDEEFTEGDTFSIFDNIEQSHLSEVVFNATDFHHGFVFRFQNQGIFGSARFRVADRVAAQVRLSDIIAASSCFTGGFEPIAWPGDFLDPETDQENLFENVRSTALMDGGIYDNQGIDSVLLSENRRNKKPYDLIIVSDVTSPNMQPFEFTEANPVKIWGTANVAALAQKTSRYKKRIQVGLGIVLLLGVLIPFISAVGFSFWGGVALSVGVMAAVFLVLTQLLHKRVQNSFQSIVDDVRGNLQNQLPLQSLAALDLTLISFTDLKMLLMDRVRALISLVGDVWLKVVRRLVYRQLYESSMHTFRRISNLIRELTRQDYESMIRRAHLDDVPYFDLPGCDPSLKGSYSEVISKKIELIADAASGFGTNLWFTPQDKIKGTLDKLVICGQITMCFNMLIYLTRIRFTPNNGYDQLSDAVKKSIDESYDQCLHDWKRFQDEPDFVFDQLEEEKAILD